jgi:peptide/nickel transport system substrate-binding protein
MAQVVARPLAGPRPQPTSLSSTHCGARRPLTAEFKLRQGLTFHDGNAVSAAEDVKFSFDRHKGAGTRELHARVRQLEVIDPLTVRFVLKEAWPDFMTFNGTTATAAGILVPKRYRNQVGDEGFRKQPIGVGP